VIKITINQAKRIRMKEFKNRYSARSKKTAAKSDCGIALFLNVIRKIT
jgi:hypothetical protein